MSEKSNNVKRVLAEAVAPMCDACIERRLGYPFKTVNPINNRFKRDGIVARAAGFCRFCGKDNKLVNAIP